MQGMDPSVAFKEWFKQFRVAKGSPFTHITRDPSATYFIEGSDLETFYKKYNDAIKNKASLTVAEKPTPASTYHVDFDFKLPGDYAGERIYSKYVKKLIRFLQGEIKGLVAKSYNKVSYCLLLEKKGPRKMDEKISDGFHLHFPYFICEPWLFEALRFKCMKYITDENMWAGVKFASKFTPDNIVDVGIGKKMWHMYGSSKDGGEPYLVTKAYNEEAEGIPLADFFEDEMSGRDMTIGVKYYLPNFLSVRLPDSNPTPLNQELVAQFKEKYGPKKRTPRIQTTRTKTQVLEDLKYIQDAQFMEMLSDTRAESYDTWMEVGWALYNIGQGDEMALKMWDEFSRRSPEKYKEGECEELWCNKMEVRNMSLGTIKYLAKMDNPERFAAWRLSNIRSLLEMCLFEPKPAEYDVARVVKMLYGDRFVCAEAKKNKWYEFRNHRWVALDEPLPLQKLILEDVIKMFDELRVELAQRQSGAESETRGKLESQENKCRKIISALKTISFVKKVIEISKPEFYDSTFNKKKDENRFLFGCNNGVLDLKAGRFREGRPDDYITLSCGYDYKEFPDNDEDVMAVEKMMKKVFPNKNIRRYFLFITARCLEGGNPMKKSFMCTGVGNNAKSKTFEFIAQVFGGYCVSVDTALFISGSRRKSNSAGPRPDLMKMKGRRIIMFQEVTKGEKLDVGVFKELSGGDTIAVRGMYQEEQEDIKPQMVIMSQFNDPPNISNDDAIWIRIRIIDFEAMFVLPEQLVDYPVAKDEKQQFKEKRFHADPRISQRFPELAPAFLWILFNLYKKYKDDPLPEPKEVIRSTNKYKNNNDVYTQYIKDRIRDLLAEAAEGEGESEPQEEVAEEEKEEEGEEEVAGEGDEESQRSEPAVEVKEDNPERKFIMISEIYTDFNDWYRENFPVSYKNEKIGRTQLCSELSKRMPHRIPEDLKNKAAARNKWFGYKLSAEDEEKVLLEFKAPSKEAK